MAKAALPSDPSASLATQIAETERRILQRYHQIGARRKLVEYRVRQKLTSPLALLLAGGVGFVVGELTRGTQGSATESNAYPTESPFLRLAGNLVESARPLFLAEMGKLMQSFSSVASVQVADQLLRFFNKPTNPSQNA